MRGWWSARPKAKVWDGASARAFERPTPAPAAIPTAGIPTAGIPTAEIPTAGDPSEPLAALFEPRPHEQVGPVVPAPSVAAPDDRAPSVTAPVAPRSFAYEAPAVESIRPAAADTAPDTAAAGTGGTETGSHLVIDVEPSPLPTLTAIAGIEPQAELLRLLEVVTSMCDHVIEYIEADRAERQQMMDTLSDLGRVITEGAASAVAAMAARPAIDAAHAASAMVAPASPQPTEPWAFARPAPKPDVPVEWRERVIGGSVAAGPEPHLDLVHAESEPVPADIAVEVRGRFGDRWVDGFEICEVMTTPSGPRYRLRRQRDGVVLPELFDASNIRHVETYAQMNGEQTNREQTNREQANDDRPMGEPTNIDQMRRERSMGLHPSGSDPGPGPNDSSGYWSRS